MYKTAENSQVLYSAIFCSLIEFEWSCNVNTQLLLHSNRGIWDPCSHDRWRSQKSDTYHLPCGSVIRYYGKTLLMQLYCHSSNIPATCTSITIKWDILLLESIPTITFLLQYFSSINSLNYCSNRCKAMVHHFFCTEQHSIVSPYVI